MSSRALRRLQEQKQETKHDHDVEEDDLILPENPIKKTNKKAAKTGNLFELLAAEEDENDDIADDENDPQEENDEPSVNKKKSKKKRNKRKQKVPPVISEPADTELDEIDRSVNQINALYGITSVERDSKEISSAPSTDIVKNKSVFSIDPRNLNPLNEMRRRFGARVVNDHRRRDPHARRFKRTTSLVTPKDNWPPYTKVGITMKQIKTESSTTYFVFEHQEIYRSVQFKFYEAVESMNHNNIAALLNTHPYHIDSMLQLSEICRINEDHQMAGELIERSLYVFECAFHTMFNITQSNCRLDYQRAENRPFFVTLYRHIMYVGDKVCYRTALELCKVLFGLSPAEDPLGVLLMFDYYALKASEYSYFVQLYDELEITRSVALLPNFAFSYALAKFYMGSLEEADKALQRALITFPSLLVQLADKCGVDIDSTIKSHPYFDPISYIKQSAPLNQLIALYVGRCHSLWKPAEVIDWLVSNAKAITDNFEKYEDDINTAKTKWSTCFRYSPQNVLRHILTSDIKEAIQCLPIEVRSLSVMTHDPLPPQDSVIGYERPQRSNSSQQDVNMLSLFLRSLMPSFNQGAEENPLQPQPLNEAQDQARALNIPNNNDGAGNVVDGARRLMDVMRDLLNTMTYRNDELPNDADGEERNGNEDDDWED